MTDEADYTERATPETLRARSMVVTLTQNDLQESIAWYTDIVGFVVEQRYEHDGVLGGVSLKAGNVSLMISQEDGALGKDRPKGHGFRIYLDTAQSVDEVAAAIKARGGTLASEPADTPWGARAFNLVDPTGFKLTISNGG